MTELVRVTDHAVLQYLARVHGLDVEHFRQHIAARTQTGANQGATGVIVDGVKFVLKGFAVVSVYDKSWPSRDLRSNREVTL
ncbi:hypothetical protein [Mycoplana ramosa]|uniref:Uncharacterized protein n=1 Tax=Mycoplana ramosa TaxID=40837 RepID=A0ABW3Z1W8_MYCRA